jgi:predicted O-methyltransferase YrrM
MHLVKHNIFKNLGLQNGTNSMTPLQVEQLGTLLPEQEQINVLEFGAGKTTSILYHALTTKYKIVNYVTYETNQKYAPTHPDINVIMHTNSELINGTIELNKNQLYDLIIVDGPDGELRKYWYKLFADTVKPGTIIHIDDAFHYPSFESEFTNVFPNTKYIYEQGRNQNINKCWITVKII